MCCRIVIVCSLFYIYVGMDINLRVLVPREQTEALDSELDVQPHRKSVQFTVQMMHLPSL